MLSVSNQYGYGSHEIDEQVKSNSSAIVNIWDAGDCVGVTSVSLDTNGPKSAKSLNMYFAGRAKVGTP